jgi:DNA-binding NtrC family response regulator
MPKILTDLNLDRVSLAKDITNYLIDHQDYRTILYIDDDYVNFLYIKDLLKNTNSVLIQAVSLSHALHTLAVNSRLSLIVLSDSLSENSDNFMQNEIKSRYPYIPIMIVVNDNTLQSDIEYLKSGGYIFINWHTDHDHLIEVITELLREKEYSNKFQIR